jgi:ureidoglycolate hydrolase
MDEKLIEIREHADPGYAPLVDYGSWRVAILNYDKKLLPENIEAMQRHDETDEVFVLLKGRCILFIGEGRDAVTAVYAVDMKPQTIYNVKKSVWHTHTLSPDATVLIVENRDTTYDNSPFRPLSEAQRRSLMDLERRIQQSGGY